MNVSKTQFILLKPKIQKIEFDNGKRLYPTTSVKYLGIKTDEKLTWLDHIIYTTIRLNRDNVMVFKVREFANITF